MKVKYLITGASGHLGMNVLNILLKNNYEVKVLVLPNHDISYLPKNIEICYGNVLNEKDLDIFFSNNEGYEVIVIHCAGIVSITSKYDSNVYNVNVNGTKNIVNKCIYYKVKKLVYVSSVHAIKETDGIITETNTFDSEKLIGLYAKTKAIATKYVLDHKDLINVSVVHPSGILGPNDYRKSHLMAVLIDFCNNKLTAAIKGGYDFVDVRDVSDAIYNASKTTKSGECYILSNKYYSMKDILDMVAEYTNHKKIRLFLPIWFVKLTVPLCELFYKIRQKPPLYTNYSLYTLESNSNFSHEKAKKDLDFNPRDMRDTIKDSIDFLRSINKIKK